MRLIFMSCQDWSVNHWGAFDHIAKNEDADLIVHLGDYIYETVGEAFQTGAVESRHDALVLPDGVFKNGSSGSKYANTLADYRYLYKKYRSDPRLQAVHERFAFVATWDDHEFSDDCWGDSTTYDNGSYDAASHSGANTRQSARRARPTGRGSSSCRPTSPLMNPPVASTPCALPGHPVGQSGPFRGDRPAHVPRRPRGARGHPQPRHRAALGEIGSRYVVPSPPAMASKPSRWPPPAGGSAGRGVHPGPLPAGVVEAHHEGILLHLEAVVSLLRMQLNGTDAIATLFALEAVSSLGSAIQGLLASTGGSVPVAAAIVAAAPRGRARPSRRRRAPPSAQRPRRWRHHGCGGGRRPQRGPGGHCRGRFQRGGGSRRRGRLPRCRPVPRPLPLATSSRTSRPAASIHPSSRRPAVPMPSRPISTAFCSTATSGMVSTPSARR
jgi:alkaline phosphatase D